jgi:hypothetical protein
MSIVVPDPVATNWVPLQGNVSERMAYWGSYSASKTYNDGDCVIGTDGILYMCVQNGTIGKAPVKWAGAGAPQGAIGPQGPTGIGVPTPIVNGQWVKGVGGAAVWSAITLADIPNAAAKPTYGITLPASPVDGQEHILVDSLTAPTYSWRCRYNAQSTNAYKWEVHGGNPLVGLNQTQQTVNTVNAWISITPTPITLPREGHWTLSASCRCNNGWSGGAQHSYIMMWFNTAGNVFGPQPLVGLNVGWWGALAISPFVYALSAGSLGVATLWNSGAPGYNGEIAWSAMPNRLI